MSCSLHIYDNLCCLVMSNCHYQNTDSLW